MTGPESFAACIHYKISPAPLSSRIIMRRLLLVITLLIAAPSVAWAQPRVMFGGGFTSPQGDLRDSADPGWHIDAGVQIGIPTLPVSLRGDGQLHRLDSRNNDYRDTEFLSGVLSVVFNLPGVGLEPYLLAGLGSYRFNGGVAVAERIQRSDTGYHGGFGVVTGQLGLGLFAEVRYVRIDQDDVAISMTPLTLGVRF